MDPIVSAEPTRGPIPDTELTARWCAALLLLWTALTLTSLGGAPLFDNDETTYAQAAVELVRGERHLLPTLYGQPFLEKPATFYYVLGATFTLLGRTAFAARLPSALCTLATALVLLYVGRRLGRPQAGRIAALVFLTMVMPTLLAHAALLDAALTCCMTGAILAFVLWRRDGRRADALLAALAAGLGVSVKGPVGLVVPLAVLALDRLLARDLGASVRRFPWPGALLAFLLGAAPWYVLVTATHGLDFLVRFILREHLARLGEPLQGHGGGWYYYLLVFLPTTLPWLAWVPWWAGQTLTQWRQDDEASWLGRLSLVWAVTVVGLFSLSQTKLPHYIAPSYPALALGIGLQWDREPPEAVWRRRAALLLLATVLPVGEALVVLPFLFTSLTGLVSDPSAVAVLAHAGRPALGITVAGGILTVALIGLVRHMWVRRSGVLVSGILFGLLLQTTLLWTLAPLAGRVLQRPLLALASAIRATPATVPVYLLVNRPSVPFYSGRPAARLAPPEALDRLGAGAEEYLLVGTAAQLPKLAPLQLTVVRRAGAYVLLRHAPPL